MTEDFKQYLRNLGGETSSSCVVPTDTPLYTNITRVVSAHVERLATCRARQVQLLSSTPA
jgi:hypothetical protein